MKCLLTILVFVLPITAISQRVIDVDKDQGDATSPGNFYSVAGEPVSMAKYVRVVEGSPYFNTEWMKGIVIMNDGKQYTSPQVKFDLLDNELRFIGRDGKEMIATTNSAFHQITLIDTVQSTSYTFVHSDAITTSDKKETGWYQVVYNGDISVLKRLKKVISENKPYGSATVEQRITTASTYMLFTDNKLIGVKKFKDIAGLFPSKKEELSKYISQNKLNGKDDQDYVELLDYYHSLTPPVSK